MTVYSGPNRSEKRGYISKFVRVGNHVSVTSPGDTKTLHRELAEQDGIHGQVLAMRKSDPDEVDAGMIRVKHDRVAGGQITLVSISAGYDLPVLRSRGRLRSKEVVAKLSPKYEVETDADPEVAGGNKEAK